MYQWQSLRRRPENGIHKQKWDVLHSPKKLAIRILCIWAALFCLMGIIDTRWYGNTCLMGIIDTRWYGNTCLMGIIDTLWYGDTCLMGIIDTRWYGNTCLMGIIDTRWYGNTSNKHNVGAWGNFRDNWCRQYWCLSLFCMQYWNCMNAIFSKFCRPSSVFI
jgi:hypothetical protein